MASACGIGEESPSKQPKACLRKSQAAPSAANAVLAKLEELGRAAQDALGQEASPHGSPNGFPMVFSSIFQDFPRFS